MGEQQIHEPIARREGLSTENLACIRDQRVVHLDTPRLMMIHAIAKELLDKNRINSQLYSEGISEFGERGMVELVGIVGYYSLVAMTLNAFEMQT